MNESDRRNIERKIVDLLYYIWSIRSLLWPYVIKVVVIIARNKDAVVKHQERSYLLTSTMNWETEFKNVHLCVQQVSDIDRSITFCCYKVKTYVSKMSTAQSLNKPACFSLDSREFFGFIQLAQKKFHQHECHGILSSHKGPCDLSVEENQQNWSCTVSPDSEDSFWGLFQVISYLNKQNKAEVCCSQ